ncbi:UNVERIFIED_CONTAM: hypothetical protein K2H54_066963 [Gekko kuhli]
MGRSSKSSGAHSKTATRSVNSFFTPQRSPAFLRPENAANSKMAGMPDSLPPEGALLTREEFLNTIQDLEKNMASVTPEIIKPLADQFADFQKSLEKVAQTADSALEAGLAAQEDTLLTREDWAADKLTALDNQLRAQNLKFRGLPEKKRKKIQIFRLL